MRALQNSKSLEQLGLSEATCYKAEKYKFNIEKTKKWTAGRQENES